MWKAAQHLVAIQFAVFGKFHYMMECEDQIKAVINDIRKRKKKLAEKSSILREVVSQHGLSESIAETALEDMVKSGSLLLKNHTTFKMIIKRMVPIISA